MKKGQIILGAVALVVTAGSTLAFKVANHVRNSGHALWGTVSGAATCTPTNCFTTANSGSTATCKTTGSAHHVPRKFFTTAACSQSAYAGFRTVTN